MLEKALIEFSEAGLTARELEGVKTHDFKTSLLRGTVCRIVVMEALITSHCFNLFVGIAVNILFMLFSRVIPRKLFGSLFSSDLCIGCKISFFQRVG